MSRDPRKNFLEFLFRGIGAGCAAGLGTVSLLALNGCASVQTRLGWKVYLDKTPITSMEAKLPQGAGIVPGGKTALVVFITEPNGKVLQTEGRGRGTILWKDLSVTSSVVVANKKGSVSLPQDPQISDGKVGHVTITVPSHPGIRADLDIPVRYDHDFLADFSGTNGWGGSNGSDGSNGTSGPPGSSVPDSPSAGGDGSDGSNGSDGGDGGPGGNAPPVTVRVALRPGNPPLLQVSVSAAGHENLYLVNPQGGTLTVSADGGRGGSGGRGGRGGSGGSGGTGTPSGRSGSNGLDGRSGWDGSPGSGGSIAVFYDPEAKPFLGTIHFSNGNGPPPVFKEEAVAPLW